MEQVITLSGKAYTKLCSILEEENKNPKDFHIRVGVESGGCSGLQYYMEFESKENRTEDDSIVSIEELDIAVNKKSFFYLLGSRLDFSSGLNGKGFEWSNPNASRSCGCGESFSL